MTSQRGNVYVEALVAVAILVVAIVPTFGLLTMGPTIQTQSRRQTEALNIARGYLEYFQTWSASDYDTVNATVPGTVPAAKKPTWSVPPVYTVTTATTRVDAALPRLMGTTVTVTWSDNHNVNYSVSLYSAVARRQ